jgi:hypothetical protein
MKLGGLDTGCQKEIARMAAKYFKCYAGNNKGKSMKTYLALCTSLLLLVTLDTPDVVHFGRTLSVGYDIFGPNIRGAHSPDEHVIKSVQKF